MMKTRGNHTLTLLLTILCLLAGCRPAPAQRDGQALPAPLRDALANLPEASTQVLLVTGGSPSLFRGTLYALEQHGGHWRQAFPPMPALLGVKGFAPPGEKREGDRRVPSGVYALRRTFGYAPRIATRMPYRQATAEDIWVDDPEAPDYNRWTRREATTAASFEALKRQDVRYKYGIVVEYNTAPVVKAAGSAIFIHVRGGENIPTMGCVALSEAAMLKLLGWLDPAAAPLAVLGTPSL